MLNQTHMRAVALAFIACIIVLALYGMFVWGYHAGMQDALRAVAASG